MIKKYVIDFLRRGLVACGIGPLVLAVLYLILYHTGKLQTLSVPEVCLGIFSLSALAFVAGGMNVLYQIERLPLMLAILIHGSILYAAYLITYLVNGWLNGGAIAILVFSGIFLLGYLAIWAVIYSMMKRRTTRLNEILQQKQQGKAE